MSSSSGSEENLETLRLVYADLILERDRLRDARRGLTLQMAAIPTSAAVVEGLFAAFWPRSESVLLAVLFAVSLVPFVGVVLLATVSRLLTPYRRLRQDLARNRRGEHDALSPERWLALQIETERKLYGSSDSDAPSLQYQFRRELGRLRWAQRLLAFQVAYLVTITAIRPFIT